MDYLNEAFGGFDPRLDTDAALKFTLNIILMDERFDELESLVTEGSEVVAVEGEPGWILRRKDNGDEGKALAFSKWPSGAKFQASVDPSAYYLQFPDCYVDARSFCGYVRRALDAYVSRNPGKTSDADRVISAVIDCERRRPF